MSRFIDLRRVPCGHKEKTMKELNTQIHMERLTKQAQRSYSMGMPRFTQGKDNFMSEKNGEIIANKVEPQINNSQISPAGGLRDLFKRRGLNVSNVDSARVIELMEKMGVKPEDVGGETSTGRGGEYFSADRTKEVMKNASLGNSERVEKAAQVLKRNLTPEEKEALLSAHNQGQGEIGKNNNAAGIYNYTEGQLLRKARILNKAGFAPEEIRDLMEAGLVGAPVDNSGISDPAIAAEMDAMNNALGIELQDPREILSEALKNVSRLTVNPAEKQVAIDRIKERFAQEKEARGKAEAQSREEGEVRYRFGLSLMKEEMDMLTTKPIDWLNGQFDHVYSLAEEGQELNSPLIQNTQNKISYAIDLINATKPELLKPFIAESTVRLHLLQMRTAIGYKDMDQVKGAAGQLRAHGLLLGMQLEQGKVGAMFNRFQDKLEETRLWSNTRHHVMLEDVLKVQKSIISEQMNLAENGKGGFEDLSGISKNPEYQEELRLATKDETMTELKIKRDEKEITEALKNVGLTDAEKMALNNKLERLSRIKKIKKVYADVTRTVRTAYDVFVSSQRMGVIVSRGKYLLKDSSRYRSDPIGPLNAYNMEDLTINRFDQYSAEQEKFVERIKLDMAENYLKDQKKALGKDREVLTREQKIDLGRRLFRDLFAVPDFFSSGWRIEGVIQALEQRFELNISNGIKNPENLKNFLSNKQKEDYEKLTSDIEKMKYIRKMAVEKAKDFALFMRLRHSGQDQISLADKEGIDKTKEEREEIWGKIISYRPEEIVRLFRERKNDRLTDLYAEMVRIDKDLELTDEEKLANRSDDEGGRGRDLTVYDKFKLKYGGAIGLLRQEGFSRAENGIPIPEQINLSMLTIDQKKIVDSIKGNGSADLLIDLSNKMQKFIRGNNFVADLLKDNEFADIYTRSIIIDDALLDKLEDEKSDVIGKPGVSELGYEPFSKIVGETGAGNDTLTRSWNDTDNAIKAGNTLIKFVKEEDLEKKTNAALEFASLAAAYNGLGARGQAECVRYTIGTYLNLTKLDMAWDIVGTRNLPFRIPTSEAGRIFGSHIKSLDRDELREKLEHLRGYLNSSISKAKEKLRVEKEALEVSTKTPEEKAAKREELEAKFAKDETDSHKLYRDLETVLEVTGKDTMERFGLKLILYLLLAAIGETYKAGETALKDDFK
jgi:hypothetical protein